jgi:hypothetical protein
MEIEVKGVKTDYKDNPTKKERHRGRIMGTKKTGKCSEPISRNEENRKCKHIFSHGWHFPNEQQSTSFFGIDYERSLNTIIL